MTLLGHDISYLQRGLRGLRTLLFPRPRPRVRPRRCAVLSHRGEDREHPENTVSACRRAIEQGADGVEVDVSLTGDGHLVLWHDRDPDTLIALARQGGVEALPFVPRVPELGDDGRKPLSQLTLEQLLATHGYDRARGAVANLVTDEVIELRIDTFADLAAWAAGEPRVRTLILDVKLGSAEAGRVPRVLEAVAEARSLHPSLRGRQTMLLSPYREIHGALVEGVRGRGDLEEVVVVPDFELPGVVETAGELGARHVSIGISPRRTWASTRDDVVVAVRARELGELDWVMVWTATDEKILRELGKLAVDAVLTDDVPLARRILDAEHARHAHLLRRRDRARIKMPGDRVR